MKKVLMIFLMSISIAAEAQSYHYLLGDSTGWYIQYNEFVVIHPRSYYLGPGYNTASGDTLINGLTYKKLFVGSFLSAFMREDTSLQKVWFLENGTSSELLLYDFSLNQGDSVNLTFPNYVASAPFPSGWYYVDSVVSKNIFIGARKHIYLSNPSSPTNSLDNNNRYYLTWIEGVGSPIHPAYIYLDEPFLGPPPGPFSFYCPIYFHTALTCEFIDGVKQYWDSCMYHCNCYIPLGSDSCQYQFGGGIEEYRHNPIKLFPNPATNQITISSSQWAIKEIEIYDILGLKCLTLNPSPKESGTAFSVDVSKLTPGIYFVRVSGEKTSSVLKLVKE